MDDVAASRQIVSKGNATSPHPLAFLALLLGNVALATGPFLVRNSGVGPIAAGYWRLALAIPFLWAIAVAVKQPIHWPSRKLVIAVFIAALFFAADLAAWHAGILLTKLGNATLFGNISSFLFAAWGLWLVRKWPTPVQALALLLAAVGCALLMWGSAELSAAHLRGDMLAALAGLLYTGYLIGVERARGTLQALPLLFLASLFGALMLLPAALVAGERIVPTDWTALFALALCSQVLGQGLLVYALGQVPPLVVGIAMLTQPALSAFLGWRFYDERLTLLDWCGAILIVAALVLVRLRRPVEKSSEIQ
ncbi:DMT family transporter [Sphingomonas sp. HDW15A]|uniref:DMT family transporter n=1 Tax=Sphingomonas sp. HDW15A TaxID=2714942 RepID=UPI00140DE753|nr:DMT family transporter [Sphingomonas sp. HDW15A]QIK97007.1 DMT family transporter [Sphingomonas sp. HDW15A]